MAEENQQVQEEVKQEVVEEVERSPDELRAMEHGWRPKDQWEGDPEDWISAKEFNRRGELFARIAKYGNEITKTRESMKKIFEHNRKLFDAGYKKAIDDLKQQKLAAVEENDSRRMMQIEEQIDNLKEEHVKAIQEFDNSVVPAQTSGPSPEDQVAFEQWKDANGWYGKNADLTKIADTMAQNIYESAKRQGKQIEYVKLLNQVSKEVRENNPQYFTPKERKMSNVDSGSSSGTNRGSGNSGKYSLSQIPEAERDIARTIMNSTGLKESEYVKQYLEAQRG